MYDIDRTPDEIVTDHACLRYLERVLDVDVESIDPRGETQRLARICAGLGISVSALKKAILAPPVRAGLAAGASRVFYTGVWIAFAQGRVTTVLRTDIRYELSRAGMGHKLRHIPVTPNRRRRPVSQSEEAEL